MVKRIPCRVVSTVANMQYRHDYGSRPPMVSSDPAGPLGEVNGDDERECFPMGMFVDVIIGD